jgi:CRISPR-associated protein Cas1
MNKRVKRPPDNPMNALVSFGNTLLYTKTITQIFHTHLNQSISYLHEPAERRFSLCLDLSEVFKPIIVFKSIFNCVNNRRITVEKHFDKNYNYSLLNDEGRKVFINEFENRLNQTFVHPKLKRRVSYLQAIKLDAYKLIKYIMEGKDFVAFDMEKKI